MPSPDDVPKLAQDEITHEITLEEWIASTQSCCGVEPESREKRVPSPACDTTPRITPQQLTGE